MKDMLIVIINFNIVYTRDVFVWHNIVKLGFMFDDL